MSFNPLCFGQVCVKIIHYQHPPTRWPTGTHNPNTLMEEGHGLGAFLSLHCTSPTDCPILRLFKAVPLGQVSSAAAKGRCKTSWECASPHDLMSMYPHSSTGAGGGGTRTHLLVGRIMRVPAPKHQGEEVGTAGTPSLSDEFLSPSLPLCSPAPASPSWGDHPVG